MTSHLLRHFLLLLGATTAVVSSGQGGWKNGSKATGEADPNVTTDCDYWANNVQIGDTSYTQYYLVQNGDTCYNIQNRYMNFTLAQFYSWNPAISGCKGLVEGDYVCVGAKGSSIPSSSSSAFPTQSGVTSKCNKWHYVSGNDTCSSILSEFGLTAAQFYSLNPATGANCSALWRKTEACVGVPGFTPSPTTSTTKPTATGPGSVPSPVQSGIASNCNKYYKVQSGDTCNSVEKDKGISAADFNKWNPDVGSDCANLQLDFYVCVGLTGSTTSITTTHATTAKTTTAPGSVPSPVQSGIASNCTKYYKVKSGDTCYQLEKDNNISAANFLKWNPAVGSDCKQLELNVYVCVAV
ncbi:Peptidoglycan-binding Lysin subgroup [Penicillium griseofulvum]|uniref:Peptidoglycan-binding Lysin subgroup n=1 Tax=Penicillium patulum TaxID=5078 RepID=A0A135LL33_PENPA|nr:Peptidoglycan-binding Lysin subgroup [Penicillium griseofulvum]KXG49682.1 Peptidoglycan-binding Lysin subgroup [Penicillium griseofulvum]